MKAQWLLAVCVAIFMLGACQDSDKHPVPDTMTLQNYDRAFAAFPATVSRQTKVIESLKNFKARNAMDSIKAFATIAERSAILSIDSALAYYGRAIDLASAIGCDSAKVKNRIEVCIMLMYQGRDIEGALSYASIDPATVSRNDKIRYHFVGQLIGLSVFDNASDYKASSDFRQVGAFHTDSLLAMLPDTCLLYDFAMAAHYKFEGKQAKEVLPLISILERPGVPPEMRQIAGTWLAFYNMERGERKSEVAGHFLLRAAISELREGRVSGITSAPLGQWFYDIGDTHRGILAWRRALDNAAVSGRVNRWVSPSSMARTVFRVVDKNTVQFRVALLLLTLLVMVCLYLVVLAWRRRRKEQMQKAMIQNRLAELTASKTQFVSHFMQLFASYIESIEEQNRLIIRKLAAGHTGDLITMLKSGKFVADQNKILIAGFDSAFLNIFPHFVAELNELLLPDRRFDEENLCASLTPELRILGLQRLGIDDSQRIARFLGLSVNTVYAYRNKMRTRVVNRDTFDEDVMKIGTIV